MRGDGVVVGVDGSTGAEQALRWAAREAATRQQVLTVLLAVDATGVRPGPVGSWAWDPHAAHRDAVALVEAAARRAAQQRPGLQVRTAVDPGAPSRALVEASRRAALVVVGSRGHGELAGDLLGSVATAVSAHAHCPVVVVRGEVGRAPGRAVVVGVDGSAGSRLAAAVAAEHAAAHDLELRLVCAVSPPAPQSWESDYWATVRPGTTAAESVRREGEDRLRVVREELALHRPGLPLHTAVVEGSPARVLAEAGWDADLVVVGSRGHGGFAGLLLGSVSRRTVHHAPCPVLVVPAAAGPDAEPQPASEPVAGDLRP